MEGEQNDVDQTDREERSERHDQHLPRVRAVEELLKLRTESEITIEATVDTGLEFLAVEECREKFGRDFPVFKERGSILFNIDKSKYPQVLKLRSVDNLQLVLSYDPNMGLNGTNNAEDVATAKKQAHTPDWDFWLKVWQELSGYEGVIKPSPEQYTVANARATKDKEAEKLRQAERQKKYKERQERNAEKKAKRKAKADLLRAQRAALKEAGEKTDEPTPSEAVESEIPDKGEDENTEPNVGQLPNVDADEQVEADADADAGGADPEEQTAVPAEEAGDVDSDDEVHSLPDYEREVEREVEADVPPAERVLRFRATCFRVGKHCFGSMEVAREFGGELQEKFNWVVDLVNFNVEVILSIHKDSAQVSLALTKKSLHRRNIAFFGPTTLRSTVCHNLLRLADIKPGDIVLDPMAGGGSISIEGAMGFPGTFQIGGDNHPKAVSRFYSNVRALQEQVGKGLPIGGLKWDSRRLPLNEGSVDVIVTDMPFGVRSGSKTSNRNLYNRTLLEMGRVARPGSARAVLLTQDRKSFSLALTNTMGLWWQTKVMSVNMGGLDAAVFTLRRTAKERPDEEDLAAAAKRAKEYAAWRETSHGRGQPYRGGGGGGGYGRGRGQGQRGWGGRGGRGGGGRGRPYPRSNNRQSGGSGGNWRDREAKAEGN